MMRIYGLVTFDLAAWLPTPCVQWSYYHTLLVVTLAPVVCIVLAAALCRQSNERVRKFLAKTFAPTTRMFNGEEGELVRGGVLALRLGVAELSFTPTHDVLEAFEWAHRLLFVAALVLVAFAVSLAAACAALTARYHAVEGVSLQGILSNEDREATIRVAPLCPKCLFLYIRLSLHTFWALHKLGWCIRGPKGGRSEQRVQ